MAVQLMKAEDVYKEHCQDGDVKSVVEAGVALHIRNDRDLYDMVCRHHVIYDEVARMALDRVGEHWCRYEGVSVGTKFSDYLKKTTGFLYADVYMEAVLTVMQEHDRMLKEIVYAEEMY